MPQFSGAPAEFMTDDDIECKRGDGWFLSYAKIAGIVAVFAIGVVAAGFLGWYINSLPRKRAYNALDLLSDEIGDAEPMVNIVTSPFIHPLKYHIELTPVINHTGPPLLKGWVAIHFYVNNTHSLNELILSAKNIIVEDYELSLVESKKKNARRKRDEANYERHVENMDVFRALYSDHEDVLKTLAQNKSTVYAQVDENVYGNLNNPKEIRKPNAVNKRYESNFDYSDDTLSPIGIILYDVNYEKEIHTITLEKDIHEGVYVLEITYHTFIDENAFFFANYSASYGEINWLMGTKFKGSEARYLFPLFNDTAHKVVFSFLVDRRPKELTTLSNMPFRILQDVSDRSIKIDVFEESPPMAPHNFAFVIGHIWTMYMLLLRAGVLIMFWCETNGKPKEMYLSDKMYSIETNLINVFGFSFPFTKLDVVVLPPGINENLGNPGLIALKQSEFYTNKSAPLVTKLSTLKTMIGLMGHQWLDKYLNTNRSHEWIFQGSLIFFQHDLMPKIDLPSESSGSFLIHVHIPMMEVDSYAIARPPHENVNYQLLRSLRDDHAKGACLIRMLHGAINDTAFRNGYKKLITRWEHNLTDISDFMNIMEEEDSPGLPFYVSLDEAMDSWISQGGYPLVTVIRNYEKDSAVVYQEQFVLDRPLESISKLWHIPLTYVSQNSDWSSPTKTWLPANPKIDLYITGNKSWVVFNVNKTGYYRVHYDEENWEMLKTALAENHEHFPVETRASLIDDVFSLAAMGLVKYEFTFDFIKYMQMKERHHLPWAVFLRHMFNLNTLLYETPVLNNFQKYAVWFVSPLYTEFEKKLKEGPPLTKIAIKLACMFEHAKCLNWSRIVFENAKSDKEIEDLIPSYIRETFYCTIARHGTGKEWNYFTERVLLTEDAEEKKRLLSSFACFQAPWILQSILNEVLQEDRFKEDEISVILKAFPRNPAAAQAASRFVRANWQEIAQRFSGSYSLLKSFVLSMVNGLTTEQDLEDLQIFRENNYDSMRGTRYAAAIVEANGNFVTMWLKHALPQMENVVKPAENH